MKTYEINILDRKGEIMTSSTFANADCGHGGVGVMYSADKAKRTNKCKHFVFNPLDVFYTTYGDRNYKPKENKADNNANLQTKLF